MIKTLSPCVNGSVVVFKNFKSPEGFSKRPILVNSEVDRLLWQFSFFKVYIERPLIFFHQRTKLLKDCTAKLRVNPVLKFHQEQCSKKFFPDADISPILENVIEIGPGKLNSTHRWYYVGIVPVASVQCLFFNRVITMNFGKIKNVYSLTIAIPYWCWPPSQRILLRA